MKLRHINTNDVTLYAMKLFFYFICFVTVSLASERDSSLQKHNYTAT